MIERKLPHRQEVAMRADAHSNRTHLGHEALLRLHSSLMALD
jgi:hypothetical protein